MATAEKSLGRVILKYTGITSRFRELLEKDDELEKIIDNEMISVVKEMYPSDYEEYMKNNELKLREIRQKLKTKFIAEIKQKLSNLFPSIA